MPQTPAAGPMVPDESLPRQLAATFSGSWRVWSSFATLLGLGFFLGLLACLHGLSQAASLPEVGLWLAGFVFCSVATGAIKVWFWLRMSHLAVLRALAAHRADQVPG